MRSGNPDGKRQRLTRRAIFLAAGCVVAAGLAAVLFGTGAQDNGPVLPQVPTYLPSFSLARLGGGPPVSLPALGASRGHPVVLVFFASWCTPCRAELPQVAGIADRAAASGGSQSRVQFIGIDVNDTPSAGSAFARRSGVRFPVGSDPTDEVAAGLLHLRGLPSTVFVSGRGRVLGTVLGPVSPAVLGSWVRRLAATALPRHPTGAAPRVR